MFVSKKLSYAFVAVCALFLSMGTLLAQNINVAGKVTDKSGEPIVGAYVLIQGTRTGATTDIDGNYKINAPAKGSLVFSCVGYKDQTVFVNSRASINIILADDSEMLENAVVVGFGTQKKANLTGAVASIDAEKALESRPIADVGRGLQGMTPGLNVQIGSSEIGSDPIMRIRGQLGSVEGGASPLILLDNVEIPSIQLINPEDIESVSVLKDAASSSIYGAKAAFGVILITSKKGNKTDKVTATYSGNFAFQSMAQKYEMGDVEALHYSVEAFERTGSYAPGGAFWHIDRAGYEAAKAWKAKYGKGGTNELDPNDPMTYGRDWYVPSAYTGRKVGVRTYNPYDYVVRKSAPMQNHNVSVAGTVGKTQFNISLGYLGQTGMMANTDYDKYTRYNANVRVATQINNWLNIHAGLMFSRSEKNWAYVTSSGTTDPWLYVFRWGPTYPQVMTDSDGNPVRSMATEVSQANKAGSVKAYTNVNLGTTITPLKNWDINLDYTYANNEISTFRPGTRFTAGNSWEAGVAQTDDNGNPITVTNEWAAYNGMGSSIQKYALNCYTYTGAGSNPDHVKREASVSRQNTFNGTTSYTIEAGNHTIKPMVGVNLVAYASEGNWSQITTLMDYDNPQFALATGTQTAGGSYSWSSTLGYFARLNYDYMNKYLFEANFRYDGTSKFTKELRWKPFYSFSAGWRFSEEPWMQGAKNVITAGKVRASWGKIGDQSVASSLYIPTMSRITSTWIHGGALDYWYNTPAAVANGLTWQDIQTLDIGLDLTLFKSLGVTFDWYQRDTKNMIVPAEGLGYGFGTTAPKGNYGNLRTKGWELALNYGHVFDNGFSLNVSGTLADAVTTITEYGTGRICTNWYNGKTYGEIWGYRVDRLYQNEDFAYDANGNFITESYTAPNGSTYTINKLSDPNAAKQGYISSSTGTNGFAPGDVKYKDLNGDGVIDNGKQTVEDHGDWDVIGNSTPRYEYSFRVDMAYKGFDLGIFFQGVAKRDQVASGQLTLPGYHASDGCTSATIANNFWYETRDNNGNVVDQHYDAYYPRALNGGSGTTFNTINNDLVLLNMAYLRLKNVTLGYTLPAKITRKASIQKLRIYASLENFLTFDKLNGLPVDPEVVNGYGFSDWSTSDYGMGRTGVGTPAMKTASFGIQITF